MTFAPQIGMIGLTPIDGNVGKAIRVGMYLNGEGFQRWEHAFTLLPGNLILEAEPGGAVIRPLHYAHSDVYWCWGIWKLLPPRTTPTEISHVAESLKGVKYSFLDYGALAAHRMRVPAPGLRDYIKDTGHMICSQMCDEFYLRLGAHVFVNNRWAGDVTPASLYKRDRALKPL